ncbi:MAG: heme-binding beta-barrel domain-containing protein [Dermabacter sp.]|nr:heme-binding beta-barrel domain-containing protein [Dermabacter sp.]
MAIVLDDSLDPSLYPLAWIVGAWEGSGAVRLLDEDGSDADRAITQRLEIAPDDAAGLTWHMRTWVLDAPAPEPPTAAFANADGADADDADAADQPPIEPTLFLEERGTWRVSGPLAGQDEAAASAARPGTPESYLSYGITLTMRRTSGFGEHEAEHWSGEVRGPRIQLGTVEMPDPRHPAERVHGARMFGLVGGRLMWLQEMGPSPAQLSAFLSVELDRAEPAQDSAQAAESPQSDE